MNEGMVFQNVAESATTDAPIRWRRMDKDG